MNRTFKLTALLLSLVLLALTLSSCGASDPAKDFSSKYNPETDFQFALEYDDSGMTFLTESPDGYYFLNRCFLYYIDKKTMEVLPLCKKPNCLHDKTSTDDIAYGRIDCEAFVGYDPLSIFYYDNAVYVLTDKKVEGSYRSQKVLQKYSADGTFLETCYTFSAMPTTLIRHRGTIYYIYQDTTLCGAGNIDGTYKLMSVSLSDKTETELFVDLLDNGYMSKLFARGKYVCVYNEGFIKGSDQDDLSNVVQQLLIYDTETGEVSTMETPEEEAVLSGSFPCKDGIMFSFFHLGNDFISGYLDERNRQYYKVGLDGKNPEKFFSASMTSSRFIWDGTYYYEDNWAAVLIAQLEKERRINVYNDAFELIDTITFDKVDNNPGNIDFIGMSSDLILASDDYLFFKDGYETATLLAVDKKQIGTGNVTPFIVWKK